jgi:hypothetical protein
MANLFLSFAIAICGAAGLVVVSRAYDLDIYTSRIFPVIPILYALVYQALEKMTSGNAEPIPPGRAREEMKSGAAGLFQGITMERVLLGIGISLAVKLIVEAVYSLLFIRFTARSFTAVYGTFSVETVARFMRGDHPWLGGSEGLALLAVIAFAASFGTGVWIGYTTRGEAILEGVIVGAFVTLLTTMTNLIVLYRKLEELAVQAADSLGYVTHVGFVAVITLQVLFYGLWSGVAQKNKQKRLARLEAKKTARKART